MILFHDIKEKQTVWVLSETPILSILKENSIFMLIIHVMDHTQLL